jgi:amidase
MKDSEYSVCDATELARLLECGDVRPVDLMTCAVRLPTTSRLNAICCPAYDSALDQARKWKGKGPFYGIPFLLKDSGLASTRLTSTLGSRLFRNTRHTQDSTLVQRFEAAGLLAFARSTVPELCMAPTTEALANGDATVNPYDKGLSAGGSSGGAAAAVASGIVPLAHASDGGGSIRIPASCCGIFGLKPSRGRVPMGPFRGEGWGGLATDGVLSRSVRDSAIALDAVSGFEPGAPYASPPSQGTFLSFVGRRFERPLRIAVWDEPLGGLTLDTECADGLRKASQLCAELGHTVEYGIAPHELEYEEFVLAHTRMLAANIAVSVDARLAVIGRGLRGDDLEPAIRDGYEIGRTITAKQYATDIARFHAVGRTMDRCFEAYDMLLTSTLARPPARLGDISMRGTFVQFRRAVATYSTYLAIVNASGQPAASVPLHWTTAGVPIGVQMIGRFGREDLLIQLASQLEMAGTWQPSVMPPQRR